MRGESHEINDRTQMGLPVQRIPAFRITGQPRSTSQGASQTRVPEPRGACRSGRHQCVGREHARRLGEPPENRRGGAARPHQVAQGVRTGGFGALPGAALVPYSCGSHGRGARPEATRLPRSAFVPEPRESSGPFGGKHAAYGEVARVQRSHAASHPAWRQSIERTRAPVSPSSIAVRENVAMSVQTDVERHRRTIQTLQRNIATESGKVATARERESKARRQAARTSSSSSAASYLREAERQSKAALDAEKRRAGLERQLADKQKVLHQAEAKLWKDQAKQQERALQHLEDRARNSERQFRDVRATVAASIEPGGSLSGHDVFISHASEDKDEVARPLADLLVDRGLVVWYDDFSLTIGDSLRRQIDRGLAGSRFGVVILSPDFFRKEWTQAELDGLVAKQRSNGGKVVLPIWHRITKDDVLAASPTLADVKALNTGVMTLAEIADEIGNVVRAT